MTKEQLIASVSAHYEELTALNKIDNFYDYESDFIKLWAKMGKEFLVKNISTVPGDRRKKTLTVFGELTIAKSHPFSEAVNGFQISPGMQQLMTYCGQLDSCEKSNEVLKEMLQIEVCEAQIYRVTDFFFAESPLIVLWVAGTLRVDGPTFQTYPLIYAYIKAALPYKSTRVRRK